jgi:AcrR family transcriptional regulator
MLTKRSRDRRVQRTHDLLHGALASLIHEKAYDEIVVKEILARANVGRSTFYTHFRHKDDLLVHAIHDLAGARDDAPPTNPTRRAEWLVRFSLPLLQHIERLGLSRDRLAEIRGQPVVHERLRQVLVELITGDIRRASRQTGGAQDGVPTGLLAEHVASTFVLTLEWWIRGGTERSAQEADDLFRALVLPTLTATWALMAPNPRATDQ